MVRTRKLSQFWYKSKQIERGHTSKLRGTRHAHFEHYRKLIYGFSAI